VVRCSECGFLAARDWETREFVEIDDKKRDSGKIGSDFGGLEPIPVCFINCFNIKEEVEVLRKAAHDEPTQNSYGQHISPHWGNYVKQVLNTERECEYFIEWQQGFTPKEHREMMDRQFMMKMEEERRRNDRKWRIIEIVLIVVLSGLFTLLGAFISRGGF